MNVESLNEYNEYNEHNEYRNESQSRRLELPVLQRPAVRVQKELSPMWGGQTGKRPKRNWKFTRRQSRRLELFALRRPAICIEYGLPHVPHTAGRGRRKGNKYRDIVVSRTPTTNQLDQLRLAYAPRWRLAMPPLQRADLLAQDPLPFVQRAKAGIPRRLRSSPGRRLVLPRLQGHRVSQQDRLR